VSLKFGFRIVLRAKPVAFLAAPPGELGKTFQSFFGRPGVVQKVTERGGTNIF
jgi:hypothetical protein